MALMKNEIPILEYDDCRTAVLMPRHERLDVVFPRRLVFPFLAEYVEEYARACKLEVIEEFVSATKIYPVYRMKYKGEDVCLCQAPVGASAAAQLLDWLIGYGVEKIISAGSCGTLEEIPENTFIVPVKALRDEGTSYHYLAPSRYVEINKLALEAIEKTLEKNGYAYRECITWSTDGFYRETKEKVEYRRSEGCSVVEMECSALAACAQFREALFGQILFTADTLADIHNYDERGWGEASFQTALELCLEAVIRL